MGKTLNVYKERGLFVMENEGDKRQFETENELTTAINEFLKANKDYNIEVTDKSLFALLLKEAGARS